MWWAISALAAPEVCNGLDDDGDGYTDEPPVAFGVDADGDGHGSGLAAVLAVDCVGLPGFVASIDDPDDLDPSTYPGAPEECDGHDQDADGLVDEDACDCEPSVDAASVWYRCDEPKNWFESDKQCSDFGAHLASLQDKDHQTAAELVVTPFALDFWLGGTDGPLEGAWGWSDLTAFGYTNWRLGQPDDGGMDYEVEDCLEITATGEWNDRDCAIALPYLCERDCGELWYDDRDGDGFGDPLRSTVACAGGPGLARNVFDCDDADPSEPALGYLDADGDGWAGTPVLGCDLPLTALADCDDADPSVHLAGPDGDCPPAPVDTGAPPPPDTGTVDSEPNVDTETVGPLADRDGDGAVDVSEPATADDPGGAWAEPPSAPSGCASGPGTLAAAAVAAFAVRRRRGG